MANTPKETDNSGQKQNPVSKFALVGCWKISTTTNLARWPFAISYLLQDYPFSETLDVSGLIRLCVMFLNSYDSYGGLVISKKKFNNILFSIVFY